MTTGTQEVDAFIAALDDPERAMVAELRLLALAAHADVTEQVEGDSVSFGLDGEDRITLGVESGSDVRLVLHRGATPRETDGFVFEDTDELATWPATDRGVMTFETLADIKSLEAEIGEMLERWLDATR